MSTGYTAYRTPEMRIVSGNITVMIMNHDDVETIPKAARIDDRARPRQRRGGVRHEHARHDADDDDDGRDPQTRRDVNFENASAAVGAGTSISSSREIYICFYSPVLLKLFLHYSMHQAVS